MPRLSLRARLFQFALRVFMPRLFPPGLSIADQRAMTNGSTARFFKPPKDVSIQSVMAAGVPAEWVSTAVSNPNRVSLYFHGGGYTTGSPTTHRDLTGRLAQACRARVLALDYRLAPEHPYPAAVEDGLAAYRWLLGQGVAPKQIVLAGDSAGGGLALAVCLSLKESGETQPTATVCISPWTDLTLSSESVTARAKRDPFMRAVDLIASARHYAGDSDLRLPLLSPLYADLHGLPPLLIHVGSNEILFDDADQLADRARAAGVDVTLYVAEGLWHVWHLYAAFVPEAKEAIERIGKFVSAHYAIHEQQK